ncbi:hypothetical protein OCU04_009123 [Sclerotinia nivalis]|uniref:Uncharacterized protein n=1 Tax=Sclerotinia nivalis TaxID=352851 RepID=A0A9X0DH19_9HELO|nr:hypothetical protein OCU04_009123 [Sclerotinia nivalis]
MHLHFAFASCSMESLFFLVLFFQDGVSELVGWFESWGIRTDWMEMRIKESSDTVVDEYKNLEAPSLFPYDLISLLVYNLTYIHAHKSSQHPSYNPNQQYLTHNPQSKSHHRRLNFQLQDSKDPYIYINPSRSPPSSTLKPSFHTHYFLTTP